MMGLGLCCGPAKGGELEVSQLNMRSLLRVLAKRRDGTLKTLLNIEWTKGGQSCVFGRCS